MPENYSAWKKREMFTTRRNTPFSRRKISMNMIFKQLQKIIYRKKDFSGHTKASLMNGIDKKRIIRNTYK